jgi:hypothetical protein
MAAGMARRRLGDGMADRPRRGAGMAGRRLADPAAPRGGTVGPRREARQVALRAAGRMAALPVDRRAGVADRRAAAVAFSSIRVR